MEKWIKNIKGTIPYTNKAVDIELNGKNLIVTGANGSGKTSFVRNVYEHILASALLQEIIDNLPNKKDIIGLEIETLFTKELVSGLKNLSSEKQQYLNERIKKLRIDNNIEFYPRFNANHLSNLFPHIVDFSEFATQLYNNNAIIRFYEEKRLSEIKPPKVGRQINIEENKKLGNDLEQHLFNLLTRQSFAISKDKNEELANEIQSWFDAFEKNLKLLFEDDNLVLDLNFNEENPYIQIIQEGKPPFTFQTLSAGYRAIFDIYADLLMHTEYFKIMPNELTGIVFIDEIDSHLHVSLQRLILPFFAQSFPKIQFIVTTHSPFVLMSAEDTIVFDLAKNEPITEDLSYYTYSAVMKGLWGVKPISVRLENSIKEIAKITNSEQKDYRRLKELIEHTKPHTGTLDNESKVFLILGMEALEEGGENV